MMYGIARQVMRFALWFFFRRIEVEHRERVPMSGPLLLVPNHANALVDALILTVELERPISLTARNTLAKVPLMGLVMRVFNVVPIHRRQDEGQGADPAKNAESLRECSRRLAAGGALCIFPEGQSHSDHRLRKFKHGAARIAMGLDEVAPGSALTILPVGLHFERKDRLRTRAWVRFGDPIDYRAWRVDHPAAEPPELTAKIEGAVRALALDFEQQYDAVLLQWAGEVMATRGERPAPLGREGPTLAENIGLVARLKDGYEKLKDRHAGEIETLRSRVIEHRRELDRLGIAPHEVYLPLHAGRAAFFVVRELELAAVGFPAAAWGYLNHVLPLSITRAIAFGFSKAPDAWASNSLFGGLVVYTFFYALQIALAWLFLPPFWAVLYTLALPYSGVMLLFYTDRAGGMFQRSSTFMRFLFQPELQKRLAAEGRSIIEEIRRLSRLLPAGQA